MKSLNVHRLFLQKSKIEQKISSLQNNRKYLRGVYLIKYIILSIILYIFLILQISMLLEIFYAPKLIRVSDHWIPSDIPKRLIRLKEPK